MATFIFNNKNVFQKYLIMWTFPLFHQAKKKKRRAAEENSCGMTGLKCFLQFSCFHEFKHGLKIYPREIAFWLGVSFDEKCNSLIYAWQMWHYSSKPISLAPNADSKQRVAASLALTWMVNFVCHPLQRPQIHTWCLDLITKVWKRHAAGFLRVRG